MMIDVAIVGAGPYGLSVSAHLAGMAVDHAILGPAMDTWLHHVPAGMLLKSDPFASSLSEPSGAGTLAAFCESKEIPYQATRPPVPVSLFNKYAMSFQERFVPRLDSR